MYDTIKLETGQPVTGSGGTPTPTPTATSVPTATPTPQATPTHTPTATSGSSCAVSYSVTSQWAGGFTANIVITNTGSTSLNGWLLAFSFANGQTITQVWNGAFAQSGSAVTLTNLSYNGALAPGGTANPGFNATWNGTNASPTAFTLNGTACSLT